MLGELAPMDFLLYDNYARSPFGRDWGLKATTGELAFRADLRQSFAEYCSCSFDTRHESLRDFGYAIGGLGSGSGYLLCVTIETPDHLGRASCAIVGLWFPRMEILAEFLRRADVRATAAQAVGNEFPPATGLVPAMKPDSSIVPVDFGQRLHLPRLDPVLVVTVTFEKSQTPLAILELLMDRLAQGRQLPKVLGATSLRDPERFVKSSYDLVCSQVPLPTVRRPKEAVIERSKIPTRPGKGRLLQRIGGGRAAARIATLVAGIGIGAYFLGSPPPPPPIPNHDSPSTLSSSASVDLAVEATKLRSSEVAMAAGDEKFLAAVHLLLKEVQVLDPDELKKTLAARTLSEVPLVEAKAAKRRELIQILDVELPELKDRLTGSAENLPYFFEGAALENPVAERAKIVRQKLGALGLSDRPCKELRSYFGFEFRDPAGTIYRWCDISDRIVSLSGAEDQVH